MAGTCFDNDPALISDFAAKDTQRLVGSVAKALAANSPYINVIEGGTFPAGVSDEIRTAVQLQAAPGDSLALPTFYCDTDVCGYIPETNEKVAHVEYVVRLESKRGIGPRVCVKKGYAAFKSSYAAAEDSLRKLITQYINSDVRAQLYLRSASKFLCVSGWDFASLFTGGTETDLGVKFSAVNGGEPDSPLSFKALHYLARYLKEALFAEMFDAGGKGQPHFRFIASADQIEYLRNEASVVQAAVALTTGGYRLGEAMISAYGFEESPAYRGLAFGVDHRPLRFNTLTNGVPNLINPVQVVTGSNGTAYARANPDWLSAKYEIGLLIADNAFRRLVPERYVGEGTFRFAPQLHMGELEWHYVIDNDCNQFGDFGWHRYQITRAYQPVRPQWIIPIAYKRCVADLGLATCDNDQYSTYTGADQYVQLSCQAPS